MALDLANFETQAKEAASAGFQEYFDRADLWRLIGGKLRHACFPSQSPLRMFPAEERWLPHLSRQDCSR